MGTDQKSLADFDGRKLLAYYDQALSRVQAYPKARDFLNWVRSRRRPTEADPEYFLGEYTFIVSVSGFRESTVKERFDRWRIAMGNFDLARLKEMDSDQIEALYFQYMLRNAVKARAVSETLGRYSARPWEIQELLERLERTKDPDVLKTLPYIGDTLKFHFARNLGLDVAKPDVHLLRLAEHFGYEGNNEGVQAMCEHVARYRKDRVGAIDYVLWYAARLEATGEQEV